MRHRCLAGAVLLLAAGVLLVAERSHGQRSEGSTPAGLTVIATSVAVTPQAPATPAPLPPIGSPPPLVRPAATSKVSGPIQQASYDAPPPPPDAPPGTLGRVPLPDNGLLRAAAPPPAPLASSPPAPAAAIPSNGLMSGVQNTPATPSAPPTARPTNAPVASVSVDVVGPEKVSLGQPLLHEIVVRNSGGQTAAEVHVEEPLPPGTRILRADPPILGKGERLSWDLGTLEAGAERRLKIQVQPADAGELNLRPSVTFLSGGLRTRVVRPAFAVEMSAAPEKPTRGGRVTFTIRAANQGDTLIHNIKLTDTLPSGLRHPAGKIVGVPQFGDLQPGETRVIALETTAAEAGQFHNEVIAQADGGIEARASADIVIAEPSLALLVDGPKQGFTRNDLEFHVDVSNPGPAAAIKPRLVQSLPPGVEPTAASSGAQFDAAQHTLVWTLPDLAPGQRQRVTYRATPRTAGDWPLYTSIVADKVPESRVTHVVHIEGAAALSLEARAREERIAVGEETVYEMHVFNQGDVSCTGVRLTVWLPDEVTPLEPQGPMPGKAQGQQVEFLPLSQLPPRGDTVYRIRVRGQRPGKAHVRVELAADKQRPVQSEISIHVQGDASVSAR